MLLGKFPQVEVIGEASDGEQLISLCGRSLPDVVLTDIPMPVMDGIEATRHITKHFPSVRVVALSMFNQNDMIRDMLNAGATTCLVKNANKNEIIDAIQRAYVKKLEKET